MNMPFQPTSLVGLGAIFTVFFVMLGPLKIIGPFAHRTQDMNPRMERRIAVLAFIISTAAVVVGGFLGRTLLVKWEISVPAMLLAGGSIFFLVGLRVVLEQYEPTHHAPVALPASPLAAAMRIAFPTIVTPYGIATLIVLLANSHDGKRTAGVLGILVFVMLLNLAAMLLARRMLRPSVGMVLEVLGAVLGVLQVALAVQLVLFALDQLGVLSR